MGARKNLQEAMQVETPQGPITICHRRRVGQKIGKGIRKRRCHIWSLTVTLLVIG